MPHAIRLATPADADAVAAIYAPIVRDTAISFEAEPPSADEFRSRMREVGKMGPWLVLDDERGVAGYAYAGAFRARHAYRFTVETTVYVREDARGRGVGRALYAAILPLLVAQGHRRAIAGVTLPNAGSVRLHESVGFRPVGVFAKVGFKFGKWHDVGFWDLELASHVEEPPEPRPVADVLHLLR